MTGLLVALHLVMSAEPKTPWPLFAMDTAGASPELLAELGFSGQSGTLNGNAKAVLEHRQKLRARNLRLEAVYCGAECTPQGLREDPALAETMTGLANSETIIWLYVTSKNFKQSEVAGDLPAIRDLKNLARKAATHNLKVALYPHSDFWVEKVADAIRLVRKVDESNFGLTLNVCHALNKGEGDKLENLAAQAADKLFVVTVNGAKRGGKGWSELIMPLDQGDLDLGPLLGQLARQGFKGVIGFQGYGIPGDRRAIHQGTMVAWRRYFAAPN